MKTTENTEQTAELNKEQLAASDQQVEEIKKIIRF